MTNKEARKLALEALKIVWEEEEEISAKAHQVVFKAIKALEETLAKQECVYTNDTSEECVAQTRENVHEPEWYQVIDVHGCNRFYHRTEDCPYALKTPLYAGQPLEQEEVDIRSRLYQRIHDLETQLAKQEQRSDSEQLGEPVAWRAWMKSASPDHKGGEYRWSYLSHPIMQDVIKNEPLYTTPQQRTWVGLTDEEIKAVNAQVSQIPPIDYTTTTYAKAIEAKLKEKNT